MYPLARLTAPALLALTATAAFAWAGHRVDGARDALGVRSPLPTLGVPLRACAVILVRPRRPAACRVPPDDLAGRGRRVAGRPCPVPTPGGSMTDQPLQTPLVWVTRIFAVNPANILAVFHGKGGNIEVYLNGSRHHFSAADLTEAGRALLVPPPGLALPALERPTNAA